MAHPGQFGETQSQQCLFQHLELSVRFLNNRLSDAQQFTKQGWVLVNKFLIPDVGMGVFLSVFLHVWFVAGLDKKYFLLRVTVKCFGNSILKFEW